MNNTMIKWTAISLMLLPLWSNGFASYNKLDDEPNSASQSHQRKLGDSYTSDLDESLDKKTKIDSASLILESSLKQLPTEIWFHIFSYLDPLKAKIHQVNRHLFELCTNFPIEKIKSTGILPDLAIASTPNEFPKKIVKINFDSSLFQEFVEIPSYVLHNFVYQVANVHESDWPYLKNTNIREADFSKNDLKSDDVITLSKHVFESKIEVLNLTGNQITDDAITDIFEILRKSQVLRDVYLWGNPIEDYSQFQNIFNSNMIKINVVMNTQNNKLVSSKPRNGENIQRRARLHPQRLLGNL